MWWKRLKKPNKEKEHELQDQIEKTGLEKKDKLAMVLSAFIVFIPVALLVLLEILGLAFIFFRFY